MGTTTLRRSVAVLGTVSLALVILPPGATAAPGDHIAVPTTGDTTGVADRIAIETAIADVSPGGTVALSEGDYYLDDQVHAFDFSGTLHGAGAGLTRVHTVDGFGASTDFPSMFEFDFVQPSDVALELRDLSMISQAVTSPWGPYGSVALAEFVWIGQYAIAPTDLAVQIRNVEMVGVRDPDRFANSTGSSALRGVGLGNASGQLLVEDVVIENVHVCGVIGMDLTETDVRIHDIQVRDAGVAACLIRHDGGTAEITRVATSGSAGLYVEPGHAGTRSDYVVRDNDIELAAASWFAGIEIWDLAPPAEKSTFTIENNRIEAPASSSYGLIWGAGMDGGNIRSNAFVGTAPFAVGLGGWYATNFATTGVVLVDNDFSGFEPADHAPNLACTADVVLFEHTSNNVIEGSELEIITVFDVTDDPTTPEYDGLNVLVDVYRSCGPAVLLAHLVDQVEALNLHHGIANGLDAKLANAIKALDDVNDNNDGAAANKLRAFISEVEAQAGVHIPETDADGLIAAAQQIVDLLTG